jgi:hypothetical protein
MLVPQNADDILRATVQQAGRAIDQLAADRVELVRAGDAELVARLDELKDALERLRRDVTLKNTNAETNSP